MYLDTAILVKLLVREPDSNFYAKLVEGQPAWSSDVVLTECFAALLRKEREGAINRGHRRAAFSQVESDAASGRLNLVPLATDVLRAANVILERVHPTVPLRSLDAIHLASAERCRSWPLCSNDARVRAAASHLGFSLSALPAVRR